MGGGPGSIEGVVAMLGGRRLKPGRVVVQAGKGGGGNGGEKALLREGGEGRGSDWEEGSRKYI